MEFGYQEQNMRAERHFLLCTILQYFLQLCNLGFRTYYIYDGDDDDDDDDDDNDDDDDGDDDDGDDDGKETSFVIVKKMR